MTSYLMFDPPFVPIFCTIVAFVGGGVLWDRFHLQFLLHFGVQVPNITTANYHIARDGSDVWTAFARRLVGLSAFW